MADEFQAGDIVRVQVGGATVRAVVLGAILIPPHDAPGFGVIARTQKGWAGGQCLPETIELESRPDLTAGMTISLVNRRTGNVETGAIVDPAPLPDNMMQVQCGEDVYAESIGMVVARTLL